MTSITAEDCAAALLHHWISRFGVPESIVTGRGRQFTSGLWTELGNLLGISRCRTTSYHPQSNGMIERQHRIIKDRLMSRACSTGHSSWMDHLPFVLLGMRTSVRSDSQCSPADLVYGTPLRLPGDIFQPSSPLPLASDFARQLQTVMASSNPMPVLHHGSPSSRVDPALGSSSHVFLRVDAVRRSLVPPFLGPFLVLRRSDKTFDILQEGKTATVSIDRLKPAHFSPPEGPLPPPAAVPAPPAPSATESLSLAPAATSEPSTPSFPAPAPAPASLDPDVWPLPTRYGRRPRPPVRLNL